LFMSQETVRLSLQGSVATLEVHRPEALNAINLSVLEGLALHARTLSSLSSVQVVILRGAGEKAFVAGADIKEMASFSPSEAAAFSRTGMQAFSALAQLPQVVISQVQGFALGGGLELALCGDFIYCSQKARFGLPEVSLGLIPGFGGTQRLAARIGAARALEWITSAEKYDAQEALAVGLVNRVLESALLADAVAQLAQKIAAQGPTAVRAAKRLVARTQRADEGVGFHWESAEFGLRFQTAEANEGLQAFLEKRQAQFPSPQAH
jgi:enoyl-CoA hydratase